METGYKYFYPIKIEKQLSFEGRVFKRIVYGKGHIIRGESLLCGTERKKLVGEGEKSKKNFKILKNKLEGKMCEKCLEVWKASPDSAWQMWTQGRVIKHAPLPELVKIETSV